MTITLHLSSYLRTLQPTVLVKSAWRFCLQTHRIPMTLHASARRLTTWISRYSMFFDVSTTFRRPRRKIHVSTTFRRPRRKVHVSTTFRRPRRKVNVSTTFRRPRRKIDVSTTFRRPRRKVHVSTNETSLSLLRKMFLPCIGLKRVRYPRGTEPRKRGPKIKRWPISASACPRKRGFILWTFVM